MVEHINLNSQWVKLAITVGTIVISMWVTTEVALSESSHIDKDHEKRIQRLEERDEQRQDALSKLRLDIALILQNQARIMKQLETK